MLDTISSIYKFITNFHMKQLPSFNVVTWDFNKDNIEFYNVMPYFLRCWKEEKKRKRKLWVLESDTKNNTRMPETFNEYKQFILHNSLYMFWSKCEYECIVTGWPVSKNDYKLDVHQQVKANIDLITNLFKDYITK